MKHFSHLQPQFPVGFSCAGKLVRASKTGGVPLRTAFGRSHVSFASSLGQSVLNSLDLQASLGLQVWASGQAGTSVEMSSSASSRSGLTVLLHSSDESTNTRSASSSALYSSQQIHPSYLLRHCWLRFVPPIPAVSPSGETVPRVHGDWQPLLLHIIAASRATLTRAREERKCPDRRVQP